VDNFRKNFKYYFVVLLLISLIFVWYVVFWESRKGLEVWFLDVGQGDASFIQAANGNQVLIDGGPNRKILNELSKVMPFYDRTIDVVIESHPDSDHIAGLIDVLKNYKIKAVVESGAVSDSSGYLELERLIEDKGIKKFILNSGSKIDLGDGVYLDVLLPPSNVDTSKMSPHDAMLVLKLNYGNNSFLFTGDMEEKMESYLVFNGKDIKSDVLKVGHHGSKTSSSELFLSRVSPRYAIISVGKDNKYGHPYKEVLERLKRMNISVFRTDEMGRIDVISDGENLKIK